MSDFKEMFRRVGRAWGWTAAQFWATLLIVLVGVGWTRVPDRHVWQVGLTFLLPLVILAAASVLQVGTIRCLIDDTQGVGLAWGALKLLLIWASVAWAAWMLLNWCDDQIPLWAGFLNSKASAHARAGYLSFEHISRDLTVAEWLLRWVILAGAVIPATMSSVKWGPRQRWLGPVLIPLLLFTGLFPVFVLQLAVWLAIAAALLVEVWLTGRRSLRAIWNWRWWIGVVMAALVGVLLPSYFFNGEPHGTVTHQVWAVVLKVAGAYLLAVASWVLLLAWAAVLLAREERRPKPPDDDALVAAPVGSGPLREDSVKLPLPESGDDAGGNI